MKSVRRFALPFIAALLPASCATGQKISSDYDRNAGFAAYRSFGFHEPLGADQAGYVSLVAQTLKAAVRAALAGIFAKHAMAGG